MQPRFLIVYEVQSAKHDVLGLVIHDSKLQRWNVRVIQMETDNVFFRGSYTSSAEAHAATQRAVHKHN